MKKNAMLGVLGGMGPKATLVFYQRIVERTDALTDQEHIPTLMWCDTGMPDRTNSILSGREDLVFSRLLKGIQLLENQGCTVISIPCNTSHYFVDRLQEHTDVPIVNMVRLSAQTMKARGHNKVGILATDGTVQTGVYQRELSALGLEGYAPNPEVQKLVMSIIYDEIKRGEKGSRSKFSAIDRELKESGCDGAILACTEFSVYRDYHRLSDYYLDSLDVLVKHSILACGYPFRSV